MNDIQTLIETINKEESDLNNHLKLTYTFFEDDNKTMITAIIQRNGVYIYKKQFTFMNDNGNDYNELVKIVSIKVFDDVLYAGIAKYDEIAGTNKQPF